MPSAYSWSESVHVCPRLLNHCNSERTTILILHFSCCLSRLSNLNLIKDEFFTILIYLNETNTSVFVCVVLEASLIPQLFVKVFHGILRVTTWGRRAWVTATAAACCCSHISSGPSWLFCRHASLPPELEKKVLQNIYFCYSRWCMRVRDTQAINSYLLIVFVRVPFYFRWSTKMRGWWFVCVDSTTD